jgi:uncharacterized protein
LRRVPVPCRSWAGFCKRSEWPLFRSFLVTADSVSMINEAAATGKLVHTLDLNGANAKFARFHAAMRAADSTRPFTSPIESWSYPVPDDTERADAALHALVLSGIERRLRL